MVPNFVFNRCVSLCKRSLKARATMTGASYTCWPARSWDLISGQSGLQVIVMKNEGGPYVRARARESAVCSDAHLRDPMNEQGSSRLSLSSTVSSSRTLVSAVCLLRRMNLRRSSSILEYMSQRYSHDSRPKVRKRVSESSRERYHSRWVRGTQFVKCPLLPSLSPQPGVPCGNSRGY